MLELILLSRRQMIHVVAHRHTLAIYESPSKRCFMHGSRKTMPSRSKIRRWEKPISPWFRKSELTVGEQPQRDLALYASNWRGIVHFGGNLPELS